jgi:DNA-directed RNA polymerase specialized sigma24 family protein
VTATVPAHRAADLIALIRRVGTGDRAALQILHADLRGPVSNQACRTLSRAADVQAVVDATFVEVFWMSRFHATTDVDVLAWVLEVAAQRATERLRIPHPQAQPCHHDEGSRLALQRLLDPAHVEQPDLRLDLLPRRP